MTTPEARPEAVTLTEEMVGPSLWLEHRANCSYLVRRSGDVSACLALLSKEEAAALEAAAQVRSAADHGGEANEMIGEVERLRTVLDWHKRQLLVTQEALAVSRSTQTSSSARAAKAVEVLREIERGGSWGQCPYCGGHPHAKSCELATLLSDHPAPEPGVEAGEVRRAALEEAALVCDQIHDRLVAPALRGESTQGAAIRALQTPADGGRDGK